MTWPGALAARLYQEEPMWGFNVSTAVPGLSQRVFITAGALATGRTIALEVRYLEQGMAR